jgi:hypothetical protein
MIDSNASPEVRALTGNQGYLGIAFEVIAEPGLL